MNKYIFLPDLWKWEEEFEVEGENCVDAIQKQEEWICLNVAFSVIKITPYGRQYIGQLEIFEGNIKYYEPLKGVGLVRSEPQ